MISQIALPVALGLAVIVLSILLVTRLRAEKRQHLAIQGMTQEEFADFLRTNSTEGKILTIAGKVSDILKGPCACEHIIFLRKQRGMLELNYYHGISRFNRSDFRLKFTPELAQQLRASFVPQSVDVLRPLIPDEVFHRLNAFEFDKYFPIFWRDNLYGVYFIKTSPKTDPSALGVIVAGLAHTLSAAYHVRWHENRYDKLQQRSTIAEATKTAWSRPQHGVSHQVLKLVRHRSTESIVPRLLETLQKEIGAPRLAYLYEPKEQLHEIRVVRLGSSSALEPPTPDTFQQAFAALPAHTVKSVDWLSSGGSAEWAQQLKQSGISFIAAFPLGEGRPGILAFEGQRLPMDIAQRLRLLQPPLQDLFQNAESFEQLEELSFTDNLTGLANQRYFRRRLVEEINRAERYNRSLALIMFDLDELKSVNDTHGHLAGDAVLNQLGPILKNSIRAIDIIARYGGDEFCVIMPEADVPTCGQFMQRLQTTIANAAFIIPETNVRLACTISLGGAVFPLHAGEANRLIFAADMALLRAKAQGRNQYILYCPDTMIGTPTEH